MAKLSLNVERGRTAADGSIPLSEKPNHHEQIQLRLQQEKAQWLFRHQRNG